MEKMNDLKALLQHEVEDLISVEDQIIEAMPAMIERAQDGNLKKALQEHLTITEQQRTRLDEVKKLVSGEAGGEAGEEKKGLLAGFFSAMTGEQKCKGMEGIITEGEKIMKADMNAEVMDAAIIACAQKIEHYEICGYGTARAYALQLDMDEAVKLLQQTLGEEYEADDRLTQMAVGDINEKAESGGNGQKAAAKKPAAASTKNSDSAPKKAAPKKAEAPKKATAPKKAEAPKKSAAVNNAPKKAAAKKSAPVKAVSEQPKKAAAKKGGSKK